MRIKMSELRVDTLIPAAVAFSSMSTKYLVKEEEPSSCCPGKSLQRSPPSQPHVLECCGIVCSMVTISLACSFSDSRIGVY